MMAYIFRHGQAEGKSVWRDLDFEKGEMARVDFKGTPKPKTGTLIWMISPTGSA
jgi:hypothetical protein